MAERYLGDMTGTFWSVLFVAAVCLCACGSDDAGGSAGGCADISGNWSMKGTTTRTTCPPDPPGTPETANISIQRGQGNDYTVFLPGLQGGCPGTLDPVACKFTSACEIKGGDGKVLVSLAVDWTFSGPKFSGSEIGKLFPPTVATACDTASNDSGTKL